MRLIFTSAVFVAALIVCSSAFGASQARCGKHELPWGSQCWHVVKERAHFALWLDDRGVLDQFADKHRPLAERFGPYWPPRKPEARAAVHAVWPQRLWPIVDCIVSREAGWYWRAHNDVYPDDSYGLFQINQLAWRLPDPVRLFDPEFNARVAYGLYRRAGFAPWRGGRYSCGF